MSPVIDLVFIVSSFYVNATTLSKLFCHFYWDKKWRTLTGSRTQMKKAPPGRGLNASQFNACVLAQESRKAYPWLLRSCRFSSVYKTSNRPDHHSPLAFPLRGIMTIESFWFSSKKARSVSPKRSNRWYNDRAFIVNTRELWLRIKSHVLLGT